ncbi:hypothetical protein FRB94_003582 [Tulasnella sp. JGI-2019a]|nr:hypothetical protein FRB93_002587 [Tulasnella sp. JGI-2019a]KAG9013142.1 hypothetical protein FRB94_003582 [Tulasnella sp. JGI-2019a]KAG9032177.1 hypothetical protein FRB95_001804 [Tulasnella sp. JGI-2019a]
MLSKLVLSSLLVAVISAFPQVTPTTTATGPAATYTGVLVSLGCWTDSTTVRNLNQYTETDANMSNELCGGICHTRGNLYSGTESGTQCYCGNYYSYNGTAAPATDCNDPCPGAPAETCGGTLRLSVYRVTSG